MPSPPPISNHRLARLALWLLATLAWFTRGSRGNHRQRRRAGIGFDKLEHALRNIIIIRAAQFLPQRKANIRYGPRRPPRIRARTVAGVWLRHRLRTRGDLTARARQLLAAFRNWRDLGAELARRRAAGLSRLVRIWPAFDRVSRFHTFAPIAPRAADTS